AALLAWADVLCPTVTDRLDAALFEALPAAQQTTRLLANFGVGFNHIDLTAAHARGLRVTNTPGVLTDATAELTIAALLALARRLGEGERRVRAGRWHGWAPTQLLGQSLTGRTLGVFGFGRIGAAVARRAELGLGMRVRYLNRSPVAASVVKGLEAAPCTSLDELLAVSDVLSLHCPSTPETRGLLNAERLRQLRPGTLLVNTARGDLIDEAALATALSNGELAGAALDVHAREPVVEPALLTLENVVLLPHLGSATAATREAMGRRAALNIEAFAAGTPLPDLVRG
ncbi:MAG: D-glycerate dehydrogenase, partial [Pseudomonadota bacterium]